MDTRLVNAWGESPEQSRWWKKAKGRALGWVCPRVSLAAAVPGAGISQSAPATPVQQGREHPAGRTGPPRGELAWKCSETLSGKGNSEAAPRAAKSRAREMAGGDMEQVGGRRRCSPNLSLKTTRSGVDTNRSELHKHSPVHPQATSRKQTSSNPAPEDSPRKQALPFCCSQAFVKEATAGSTASTEDVPSISTEVSLLPSNAAWLLGEFQRQNYSHSLDNYPRN